MDDAGTDVLDLVRERCARVAAEARFVTIDHERLGHYASTLPQADRDPPDPPAADDPWAAPLADAAATAGHLVLDEQRAALVVALDAVNFGSGYHPHVTKLAGLSGARTMATRLRTWAGEQGGIRADALVGTTRADAHRIFGQPETSELVELMGNFATALDELGRFVVEQHHGSFLALVGSANGSAARLVTTLAALPTYADVSQYHGYDVPLLKRAQITPADLHRAFAGRGPGELADIDRLTAFADNLVPHVLRVDGVLRLDPDLESAIDREELLVHGDEPEVELRATAVHVVELLVASSAEAGHRRTAADLDQLLWARGGAPRYKAIPRPRARTTAY
jgi:hypothetical protein